MSQVIVVPNPFTYEHCAVFNRNFCHLGRDFRPHCPAECLGSLSNAKQKPFYKHIPRLRAKCRSLDITEDLKIQVNQVEIPLWYTIDYSKEYECFVKPTGVVNVGQFKGKCSVVWNLDTTVFRNVDDSKDFPPLRASGMRKGEQIWPAKTCKNQTIALPNADIYKDQTIALADFFWICGKRKLLSALPLGWRGKCTRVRLIQELHIIEWDSKSSLGRNETVNHRVKRNYIPDPKVYIDSIGQPKGIQNQFKARDEVKSGLESIFIWISQNKNTEWINYIYYNQQRFINYTNEALISLGEQLDATSKMTWQNRLALNWMLADKGGVCVLFGDQCCTYIPNNTAPEGTFTKAMAKLKELQVEMATNAGRDEKTWDWFNLKLGSWGAWLAKLGILLGVTIGIGGLLFCCILPLLKSLVIKATVKQMDMSRHQDDEKKNLTQHECYQDLLYKTALQLHLADEISTSSDDE
ncbi:Syncytin-A [Labeo rohita]|uniref:Syncytin-A n=1 Tax=Labeo rohita TaxID=84645 RepID=A0ABQ8LZC1_LABRO|nr:Syncytin-A [Labeo rohita]